MSIPTVEFIKRYLQQHGELSGSEITLTQDPHEPLRIGSYSIDTPTEIRISNTTNQPAQTGNITEEFQHEHPLEQTRPIDNEKESNNKDSLNTEIFEPLRTGIPLSHEERRRIFIDLYKECNSCVHCSLGSVRKKIVFGAGNVSAPLLIIGYSPEAEDDLAGLPLTGKNGELMEKMLNAINLDNKDDIFLTNLLKCRAYNINLETIHNATPCVELIHKQIQTISPKAILVLDPHVGASILDIPLEDAQYSTLHQYHYKAIPLLISYSPVLLAKEPEHKRAAWTDLKRLKEILEDK